MALNHAELLVAPRTGRAPSDTRTTAGTLALAAVRHVAVLLPFALTGALYELLRGPFSRRGAVHVADLLALESRWFSISTAQGQRPLSEVIASHPHAWLDLWCGATYLLFLIEIAGASFYLSFRSRARAWELSLGFLTVNVLGWLIWLQYPAAPPWYVDVYGLQSTVREVGSSAAGLLRFDALLGAPLAASFYAKSANVFGAMPSLHVAYATLVACVVAPLGGRLRLGALAFALSMAFSAVYLRHHYLLDVFAGVLLALAVVGVSRATRWLVGNARAAVARRAGAHGAGD